MNFFSYFKSLFETQAELDPNRSFIRTSRDELRRKSVSLAFVPAGIATLLGATLNLVRLDEPNLELAIPEMAAALYCLFLSLYYRFLPFKQFSALFLLTPIFMFFTFLFGSKQIDSSIIILLSSMPLASYFLFERKLALPLSIFLMTLGGLAYIVTHEQDGHWLHGRVKYNVFFAEVVIIGMLHFYTGIQRDIENQLLALANFDGLTGLGNIHYYNSRSAIELSTANRNKSALSLIMLDVDFFKKVNDTYGHDCGDLALKLIAAKMQEAVRATESCFRLGGEEFVVIQAGSDSKTAALVAERLRKIIESTPLHYKKHVINLTASFGVATLHDHADNLDDLYAIADKAMYLAKQNGRNRVEVAG